MTGFSTHGAFLAAFATAPGLGVVLFKPDSTMLFVNETAVRLYGGGTIEEHIGRKLADLYPAEWAESRTKLLQRVAETDERLLGRTIWHGRRLEVSYQRVPDEDGDDPRVLVIIREGLTPKELLPSDVTVVDADILNLGPLSVLTPRELEVLALIGQGKSAKGIAEVLGCSPRTVERHRDSIGKKLDKRDRVSLALVARAAGLSLRDARVKHVESASRPTESKPGSQAEVKPEGPKVNRAD